MDGQSENMQVDLSEALGQDGQLILTNEDGNGESNKILIRKTILMLSFLLAVFPVGISGMITLPVTAQMYHQLVQQQMPNNDNTVCVTPMQVQNFISNNSLCSIANSNLNSSTTYIMTAANNRNVINLPLQATAAASNSNKTVMVNTTTSSTNVYSPPNTRTIVKKSYMKKRVLNLAIPRTKLMNSNLSQQSDAKKSANHNNNSSNIKNRNKKVEKLQTSQNQSEVIGEEKKDSLIESETKVKKEDEESTNIEIESKPNFT